VGNSISSVRRVPWFGRSVLNGPMGLACIDHNTAKRSTELTPKSATRPSSSWWTWSSRSAVLGSMGPGLVHPLGYVCFVGRRSFRSHSPGGVRSVDALWSKHHAKVRGGTQRYGFNLEVCSLDGGFWSSSLVAKANQRLAYRVDRDSHRPKRRASCAAGCGRRRPRRGTRGGLPAYSRSR